MTDNNPIIQELKEQIEYEKREDEKFILASSQVKNKKRDYKQILVYMMIIFQNYCLLKRRLAISQ